MLFRCDNCGCVDDTDLAAPNAIDVTPGTFLCSRCRDVVVDGVIQPGIWHGQFPQEEYDPEFDIVVNQPNGIGMG